MAPVHLSKMQVALESIKSCPPMLWVWKMVAVVGVPVHDRLVLAKPKVLLGRVSCPEERITLHHLYIY